MLEGPGKKPPPTLTQLHEKHGPGPSGSGEGEYLHRDGSEGGVRKAQLYTRAPLMLHGSGEKALATSLARQKGAQFVKKAMANEYPRDVVEAVFWNVREKVHKTENRLVDEGMTRGDLNLLHEELQYQGLQKLNQELQQLRSRVAPETPEAIKDDLAQVWRSPSNITRGQWPSEDGLISRVTLNYLQYAEVRFDEAATTLRLTQRVGAVDTTLLETNMRALAGFIGRHFGAEPGRVAFEHIASNILSYLPRGKSASASMLDKMQVVADNAAHPDATAARSMFTFSVTKDGNVGVVGDTSIPFRANDDGGVGRVDLSKFSFARHEEFEISGKNLTSAPTVFEARANLVSVNRFDTIDLANSA